MRTLITALLVLVLTGCAARNTSSAEPTAPAGYTPDAPLSGEAVSEDLDLLFQVLTRMHPGYDRFASPAELDGGWSALDRLRAEGATDSELYLEVSRFLALLRCDHSKAEVPRGLAAWRETHASYLPVRLEFVKGKAYVVAAAPGAEELIGQELLAINGTSVASLAASVRPLIPIDGYTDASKELELGYSSEFQGSAFDHFIQLMTGFPSSFELELANRDGDDRQLTEALAITYPEWLDMATAGRSRYRNFKDEVSWRMISEDTAYLAVNTFVNYRDPVDPDEVFGAIMRQLNSQEVQHLVVDLRENGGGSTEPGLSLLRFLMTDKFTWGQASWVKSTSYEDLVPYLRTWDDDILNPKRWWFKELDNGWYQLRFGTRTGLIRPHRDHFRGKVTVLVGPANSSGSTMVIAELRDQGRVRLVGGPTGGNPLGPTAGQIVFLDLPNSGITVRVPLLRIRVQVDNYEAGQPIMPDVLVEPTIEDIFAGRDIVLEAALQHH